MKSFTDYDRQNPHIYSLFCALAYDYIKSGRRHLSAKLLIEEIRWHKFVGRTDYFKVSNSYTSMYARKFLLEHPQYAGFFTLHPLISRPKVLPN